MKKTILTASLLALLASPALAHDDKMDHMNKSEKADMKAGHWFEKIDTNGDGKISKEEHTAFGDKMFSDTDTNHDGFISMDEMKAMKMKEMDEMKSMHKDMAK